MVVKSHVGRCHAGAKAFEGPDVEDARPVVLALQPLLRPGAGSAVGGLLGVQRQRQGFKRPLVGLLVFQPPNVADHAVGPGMHLHHALLVRQHSQQLALHLGRGNHPGGFHSPQVIHEKITEPLAIDR